MEQLLGEVALERPQHASRLAKHVLAQLACMGSHTVTGLLSTCGDQFVDWSAHYRLYERERADPQRLFDVVRSQVCALHQGPIVAALDDTRLPKSGRKVHGARYTRDPMGPPFHVNFIRAQRFLQTSAAIAGDDGQARMIPVDWVHAPAPPKPGRKATREERAAYRDQWRLSRIGAVGAQRIAELRRWINEHDDPARRLWTVVDGSFCNSAVLKALPDNTTLVGRVRSDAKLYHLPDQQPARGRRRVYGLRAPTPEQVRQDDAFAWQDVEVFFGGKRRRLRAKRLGPVRWRPAGKEHDLQLIVIAPTSYRLCEHGTLLYRDPAYLLCTDPDAPLHDVIQHYIWRWDIEANFRDEKTLLGVGDAQVRTPAACQNVTAVAVAAYAMLLVAAERCQAQGTPVLHLPRPKWQRGTPRRATTMTLIQNLRNELWAQSIHFSSFVSNTPSNTKPEKCTIPLDSAVLYASRYS